MVDSMLAVGLVVAFGLLARLARENQKLVTARRRTAALMRRVRQQRDAYAVCLEAAGDEYQELHERAKDLEGELVTYRREDARREIEGRVWS